MRAFSLLEMMIVLSILGVLAAVAVPNLQPTVQIASLQAAGHAIGGFATQARLAAMSQRRCVRLRILSATAPPIVVAESLNSFDCENPSAPLIVAGKGLWTEFARIQLDKPVLALALNPAPSETPGEIRFRPSGRNYSSDDDLTDDDAVITITHPALISSPNVVRALIDAPGPVCVFARGDVPTGSGNDLGCRP